MVKAEESNIEIGRHEVINKEFYQKTIEIYEEKMKQIEELNGEDSDEGYKRRQELYAEVSALQKLDSYMVTRELTAAKIKNNLATPESVANFIREAIE